jgi:uncharacterized protein (DUF488 family)
MRTIYTIGHSTHPIEEFIGMLGSFDIGLLVDIRTVPRSRHNPQFEKETLAAALNKADIGYHYLKKLGGLRKTRADSPNKGWRNLSFRGYADYMQTEAFTQGLNELIALADQARTAIMCAESVPWRCHRSLVGDALLVRGWGVLDIMGEGKATAHKMTGFAQVEGERIIYPPETGELF